MAFRRSVDVWILRVMEVCVAMTLDELRQSAFHQELGLKMCAAFIAQQQGVSLSTALKKVPDHVGDAWLVVADFTERTIDAAIEAQFASLDVQSMSERMM